MTGPEAGCELCGKTAALFNCLTCDRPICDACARAAPGWRFVCNECPVPDDRQSPWSSEEHAW